MKSNRFNLHMLWIPVCYLVLAVLIVLAVAGNGVYPAGSDTMYHIYRGEFIYESVKDGTWFPMYDTDWYNGVELQRYWPPLPAYVQATCQALAAGDAFDGYLLYVGFIFFFGALSWYVIGIHRKRPFLGAFLGALWFFMPNNLYALFSEGNLPRALCMVFLPLFLYSIYGYLENRNYKYIPAIIILTAIQVMCHLGYAGMIALAVILYLVIYAIITGKIRSGLEILFAVIIGFLLTGIWMIGSLFGGITGVDSSETMAGFFQDAWITLNPLKRYDNNENWFYFGLAAFLLAVFGSVFSGKKSNTGFITAIVIFLLTTTSMYYVLRLLPGGQYLWMLRFVSIALCMIMLSFLYWKTVKKWIMVLVCILLLVDTIPSLELVYGDKSGTSVTDRMAELEEAYLISQAKEITEQRMALLDLSTMGSMGAYLVSGGEDGVAASFGAGWEAAVTSTNIVQINKALEGGNYLYLFDRCKELGNDTVLIKLSEIDPSVAPVTELESAAAAVGYAKVGENTGFILYHLDVEGNWGTVTDYPAIGIGSAASSISLQFPAMEETSSANLNDYTFEDLADYELIYLAGFTYDDRAYAEDLILKLSEAGVHIVIAADGIPEDRKTHDRSFLGVTCNTIMFSNGYPELDTVDGIINADLFPKGYTEWSTVYLEGLDEVWGTVFDNDLELDFYGTVKNENIVMIGLNLTYHYGLTKDPSVGALLSHAMELSGNELPPREIVPLEITYDSDSITINCPTEGTNTTLAYHDIFSSESVIYDRNHLMYVDEGITVIQLNYPYFISGLSVSILGIVLACVYSFVMCRRAHIKSYPEKNEKNSQKIQIRAEKD